MGYPAPDDVGSVSGLVYYLVAIPDDPAYRRAALDAYSNLANQWMWGEDARDPDADQIEQQWLDAIYETLDLISMGWPTQVLESIDDIEDLITATNALLQALQGVGSGCCPDNLTYLSPDNLPEDSGFHWDDNRGDPPTTWGESESVADADDYKQLLCGQADRYVDYLVDIANQFDAAFASGAIVIGLVAAALTAAAVLGLVVAIAYADAAAIVTAIIGGATAGLFSTAASDIEAERDNIKCAFVQLTPGHLSDTIEASVSALAWSVFFQFLDYESPLWTAETGEFDGQYLDPVRDDSCDDCETIVTLQFHVAGGTVADFDTLDDMDDVPLVFGKEYKLTQTAETGWQLEFYPIGGSGRQPVDIEVIEIHRQDTESGSSCGQDPALLNYDTSLSLISSVTKANHESYADTENSVGRQNNHCLGAGTTSRGYMIAKFWPGT